jgi:hypothetical protein
MRKIHVGIAFTLGFMLGGFGAADYLKPAAVSAANEPGAVRGQSFVLTDSQGNAVATFRIGPRRSVVLIDQSGNEIWRAPAEPRVQPLNQR